MEENKNTQQENSEDKLVTVAIHTYEKALILKSILESEGIPVVIHGVRLIEPVVPGNARVRISEKDLPKALEIIEKVNFSSDEPMEVTDEILVPVDFSDYSLKACEFAFRLAQDAKSAVKMVHAFFTPFYPATVPFGDSFALQATDTDLYKDMKERTDAEMKKFVAVIDEKIASNKLPNVPYSYTLMEGLPEEEIISYSKKNRPRAIVMGTRGKNAKELDLIGSVTAEVMDGCKTPIFAIPVDTRHNDLSAMKNIVFLTNFREREFKAFEIMMSFLKSHRVKVFLAHITKKEDVWNEMKLSGLTNRLKEIYPLLETEYKIIDQTEGLEESIESFLKENNVDMIALSSSRRNIFARMFNPGIARRMLFHSDTPLLVVKGL